MNILTMPLETINIDTLEKIVIGKCESFVNMSVWPAGGKLRPKKWLSNFTEAEKEHALYLLNSFCYYNVDFCTAMLKSSILKLSNNVGHEKSIEERKQEWHSMIQKTIFIPSTGERRNITDSGIGLSSYLRRNLKIHESQVLTVDELYGDALRGVLEKMENIVFFDDLIGSGKQFNTMYGEEFEKDTDPLISIKDKCKEIGLNPYFCTLLATSYGIGKINEVHPEVVINYANILEPSVSPFHEDNIIWPTRLKKTGIDFINTASLRAGIKQDDIQGYHNLGLSIAFDFTIPDSTLPIFRHQTENWSALMEKS